MDIFIIRKPKPPVMQTPSIINEESSKIKCEVINVDDLPADSVDRRRISKYNPNDLDRVRKAYLQRGPYQPRGQTFPQKVIGKAKRRFNPHWFDSYRLWLEYSVKGDATYCLYCYLCADDVDENDDTSFTTGDSITGRSLKDFNFMLEQSDQTKIQNKTRLLASIGCVRFLLHQGLAFRGHNESISSNNIGNFKELLKFLAEHNEETRKVILENAPGNSKLSSHQIQLDITSAYAQGTSKAIVEDIGGDYFSILVDECRYSSTKEQMTLVVRYVNNKGYVIERFLGIAHVTDTCSLSLKEAIESILSRHKVSVSRIRGQGYDGANNMRGEFNGVKSLFLKDNSSAYYVHYFAHQLQLVLVAVAKNDPDVASFFTMISRLVNVVGGSCKRKDILREKQAKNLVEAMDTGETESGRGLHQEYTIQRANDTRWSSHFRALVNTSILFPSILEVLEYVFEEGANLEQKGEAKQLLAWLLSYDFAFTSIMMKNILGITNELSSTLQKKDLDIVNAINLVDIAKQRLGIMRKDGWEQLDKDVSSFCHKYNISVPRMDDTYKLLGIPRRVAHTVTIHHHYEIEIFKAVIDWMLQELNYRFNEVTTELLGCMSCLIQNDSFSYFKKDKLVRLAEFYPADFPEIDRVFLENQLETFLFDMKSSVQFNDLRGVGCRAANLVETKKQFVYPLVTS